jgi:Fe-S cluster biogenesis protein NfuA|tara:strand:+ start:531 stop:1082 length:552 start_codon:yes stop_codon:yes gene_type:complete
MIQTELTPNPNSLKFLSEKTISAIGTEEFQKNKINESTVPFVKELLNFKGVELILLSEKFLSVKKTKEVSWSELKPMIISHLNDYFEKNNEPILMKSKISAKKDPNNDETVNKIVEVLDTKIRPAVARDGGDIRFKSFENGVVKVQLQGSCSGCPSSLLTLKQGVQNLLKHYVKEVNSVEAIE